ncbi:molybdopterin-dependent oxidoreductase [Corynebacterium glutamicum]|nr:hypothetical protein B7P23_13735 [Corynebacterium glutamicum]AUI02317.1 hypothetical protein CYL77_14935 [Corynebacterium glutamicum]AUI03135.1 hypothetical protein C0I99_02935 [Corynebacterium glutamicum]MBA4570169.1 molybdopterin-dependent oxidoreductase [Corynebacterium glutamicum]MBA4573263.1 molybdopterin-dependent oxidoreductase [Corynebacterium glutamicum]
MVHMVFGDMNTDRAAQAYIIVITTIVMVVLFWIVLSYWSLADRARAQRFTASITEIGRKIFLNRLRPRMSRQNTYTDKDISQFHWTNGLPPTDDESPEWIAARDNEWEGYTITLGDDPNGTEKTITLDDLRELPQTSYVAVHTCMQGWSATARWTGVRLRDVLCHDLVHTLDLHHRHSPRLLTIEIIPKPLPPETRCKIIDFDLFAPNSPSIEEFCSRLKISRRSFYNIRNRYQQDASAALHPRSSAQITSRRTYDESITSILLAIRAPPESPRMGIRSDLYPIRRHRHRGTDCTDSIRLNYRLLVTRCRSSRK